MAESIHSFAKRHGLSKSSVHAWLKNRGYDTSRGLSQAARDAALAHFVPMEPAVEVMGVEPVGGAIARMESRANPLVPISIETLNINITTSNTRQLGTETAQFQQVSAAALQGIGEYLGTDLENHVVEAIAQNRHAVAGLNAAAAAGLANRLGKHQAGGDGCPN